ncbi:hypothetical protein STEG23_036272 [Scotinomys teguina]
METCVLSSLAKNLFHRAISESGVVLTTGLFKKNTRPLAEKIAAMAGCKTTTSASMVHCLRQKTEEELLETTMKLNLFKMDFHGDSRESYSFIPTVLDGVVLPKMPEEILAEKSFNTVPYIVGINKQEFGWLMPTMMNYPPSDVKLDQKTATSLLQKSSFILNLPEDKIPLVIKKYLRDTDDPDRNKEKLLEMIGDVAFGVPSVIMSRGHRDAGAPTYMYEFQYHPSFSSKLKPKTVIGDHGDEVYSVFGAPILRGGTSEEEINLSKMVMKFWANFARNGSPGHLELFSTALTAEAVRRHSSVLEGELSWTPPAAQNSSSALKVFRTPGAVQHSSDSWNCNEAAQPWHRTTGTQGMKNNFQILDLEFGGQDLNSPDNVTMTYETASKPAMKPESP